MTATHLMELAPVEWEKTADKMSTQERDEHRRELEGIALRAAELSAYLDARAGGGCGDQGHKYAVKCANRAGKKVWCGAFGYNDCHAYTL